MKICTFCKEEKPLSEFNKNRAKKDGLQNKCRPCSQAKFKEYYNDNKEHHRGVIKKRTDERRRKARELIYNHLKDNSCVDCGATDIRVLEFDHRPGVEKVNGVAYLATFGYALDVVQAEMDKCEVRCRNCHMIKTYERAGGSWHDQYLEIDAPLV